jgi:tetratricopeptide (TPR) repeat protein
MATKHPSPKRLSNIRSCYEFVGRAQLKIDMAAFARLPLQEMTPIARQFLYAVLQLNRGKAAHALAFIRQAKESATKPHELAYVLYAEGLLLLILGESDEAIGLYKTCIEICGQIGEKGLHFDALLLLSSVYTTMGEPAIARVYEQQAALILPRNSKYI